MPGPSPSDIVNGKLECNTKKCDGKYTWHRVIDPDVPRMRCTECGNTRGPHPHENISDVTEGHRERVAQSINQPPQKKFK